jgi:hypothetical protein
LSDPQSATIASFAHPLATVAIRGLR